MGGLTPTAAGEGYLAWLERQPLAQRTRDAYRAQVGAYLAWLEERPRLDGDPLAEPGARDWAVRDFKQHVKRVRYLAPASVNLALAAIDSLYGYLGLGPALVRREELPAKAPRALDGDEQRRLLREAERASARDRAVVVVLLYTALRLSELVALDVDDARITARKGVLVVRSGKGDAFRVVPLNPLARQLLGEWLAERRRVASDGERALFVGRAGRRLARRSVDDIVRGVGRAALLELSAHVLRYTCLTLLVRQGTDLVLVAELAGHRRLETTRRYSLPSEADRQAAVDRLPCGLLMPQPGPRTRLQLTPDRPMGRSWTAPHRC